MGIDDPGQQHRALGGGVRPFRGCDLQSLVDAAKDGRRRDVRVEVVLVRPRPVQITQIGPVTAYPLRPREPIADLVPPRAFGLGVLLSALN